ncbi:zinc finger protein 2 [Nasonia vitripennis]|uniref:Uncharacterized protein n=1 Tax=Nasonia vitripennis TaxID=7425 RepID=A0A7M7GCM9_NASVI|nr:zinc finger protein 2 [Nasonia vitripennis]
MKEKHHQLCRLCAESKSGLVGIYEAEGQSLEIESKIAKCLRIQVFVSDCLPLSICHECCTLLNQCNDFYEKTNQAQCNLRHMLTDSKETSQSALVPDVRSNFVEKTEDISKGEVYVEDLIAEGNIDDEEYSDNSENNDITTEKEHISQENVKYNKEDEDSKITVKKGSPKQNNKKKVKRKISLNKGDEDDFQDPSEVIKKEQTNVRDGKSRMKIPDNYMTGTESDMELIVLSGKKVSTEQLPKSGRKRGERLDRYPWLCTDCNDKLPSLDALEEHHETVHNQKTKYMCVQCCKVYEKYYGFLTHVKRHKTKTKYSCDDCGKTFVHKKVLDTHKAIHSEERPHVCQTCGKSFRQQSALYIHSRCHLPENMKNRFQCDQCDKRFSTKPNLVTHKRIHSGVRNFTCDQCGKSFIQKGNLEAHFLTHSADKPYKCSQCSKAFKTPLQLKKHETVHTGAKPHQCAVCGRTFREKGTLREHHRIHTGAMPFSCEFCGKCFRFKGILTTHRRQHTGERPYSCQECQHHFTNWPNYNKHMKRRHGINTSSNKQQQPNQQQQQESQRNLQNQSQNQTTIAQTVPHSQPHTLIQTVNTAGTVQVIQAIPRVTGVTVTQQPIVMQTLPTGAAVTAIQTFAEATMSVPTTAVAVHQQQQPQQQTPAHHQNSGTTTFFNAISTPLSNFLPTSLPYNFYNISNAAEADLVHHR